MFLALLCLSWGPPAPSHSGCGCWLLPSGSMFQIHSLWPLSHPRLGVSEKHTFPYHSSFFVAPALFLWVTAQSWTVSPCLFIPCRTLLLPSRVVSWMVLNGTERQSVYQVPIINECQCQTRFHQTLTGCLCARYTGLVKPSLLPASALLLACTCSSSVPVSIMVLASGDRGCLCSEVHCTKQVPNTKGAKESNDLP